MTSVLHQHGVSYYTEYCGIDSERVMSTLDTGALSNHYQAILDHRVVNQTESRPVTHHQTRHPDDRQSYRDLQSTSLDSYRQVCHVGLGGSVSGVRALYHALSVWGVPSHRDAVFVSSHDEDHIDHQLRAINIDETLFVVVSKSGQTDEIHRIMATISNRVSCDAATFFRRQCITVTTKHSALDTDQYRQRFLIDEGVGGRFSTTSSVGMVTISLCFGDAIRVEILDGAYAMDQNALTMNVQNMALLQACIHVQHRHHHHGLAMVPYGEALSRFNDWWVQLMAESLGKGVQKNGEPVTVGAPIIVSGVGPNAQHTFFQQVHQSHHVMPVEFISVYPHYPNQWHMLQQITGQMVDPYHGQDHLHQRLLACVGHPMDRFSEDMLRPFRCFRFMSQLGLSLSPTIQQALRHLNQPISLPSMERIRHEMDRLLLGPFWQSALHAMHQYGWLQHITTSPPDLQHVPELPNDALYRWAWLLSTHHLANASSLCFSKKDMRTMQRMIDWNFDDYAVSLTQHDLAISSDTLKALGYHGRNLGMIQRTILHALRTRSIPNTLDAIHGFLSNQSPPQN